MLKHKNEINVATLNAVNGFRTFMCGVYRYMALGIGLSALMAFLGTQGLFARLLYRVSVQGVIGLTGLGWLISFAPFVICFVISSAVRQMNTAKARLWFFVFAGLTGLSFSSLLFIYTGRSLLNVFLVTALMFEGASLYGARTGRDLTGLRGFMTIGLFGLIIASLVNIFMASGAVSFGLSIIGVVIFSGLIMADTQMLKSLYHAADTDEAKESKIIMGALALYLDVINLFLSLLRILGDRK